MTYHECSGEYHYFVSGVDRCQCGKYPTIRLPAPEPASAVALPAEPSAGNEIDCPKCYHAWSRHTAEGCWAGDDVEVRRCSCRRPYPAAVSDPEEAVGRELKKLGPVDRCLTNKHGDTVYASADLAPLIAAAYDKGASEARQAASRIITSITEAHARDLAAARAELETAKHTIEWLRVIAKEPK